MKRKNIFTRREFVRLLGIAGAGATLAACKPGTLPNPTHSTITQTPEVTIEPASQPSAKATGQAYLAVTHGEDPAELTRKAIAALGGMERFVKQGANVIIKPNICTDYHTYEYAATTNPDVVEALVSLCLAAGAKRVRVMDNPFGGTAESAYRKSGISEAVAAAGGQMEVMNPAKFAMTPIPEGRDIKQWDVYQEILDADTFIDVPIAKHHGEARLTLACKNLMGTTRMRSPMHSNLHQRIADLTSLIRPDLTVVDAYRILTRHGPTGGNLNDVKMTKTVIASHDIVAADTYACTLFGLTANDIPYVNIAADMGLGNKNLSEIKIEELVV